MTKAAQAADPMERLRAAIAPYEERLLELWGFHEYPALKSYLEVATAPWRQSVAGLAKAVKAAPADATLIIVGERESPASGDPLDSDQYLAAIEAARRVESGPFHILFTGGCTALTAHFGEIPAMPMAKQFSALTSGAYDNRISAEQLSLNTGHQGRIIGQIVKSRDFRRLVICQPNEHIARFCATLAFDLHERGLHVPMHFFGNGNWEDFIVQREMTRAQEAFGPIQPGHLAKLPSKALGGEYSDRLATECDPKKSRGYACGALPPSLMLEHFIPKAV